MSDKFQPLTEKTIAFLTKNFDGFREYFNDFKDAYPHIKLIENPYRKSDLFNYELYVLLEKSKRYYVTRLVCSQDPYRLREIVVMPATSGGGWMFQFDAEASIIFNKTKYFYDDERSFPKIITAIQAHPDCIKDARKVSTNN